MSRFYGITFELGTLPWTGLDRDGYPIAQHDGFGDRPGIGAADLHHSFGFVARPRDPDCDPDGKPLSGKACNALIGKMGDETHLWLAYDPRFIPNIPQLKKGGAAMYSAAGSFRVLDGDDGTETFYCPVPGDKAHIITTGLDGNGKPFIGIEHSSGLAITMLEGSVVIKNEDGSAYVEVNDQGVNINGNVRNVGALAVDMATVGPAGTPVVHATPLVQLLVAMAAALDALPQGMLPPGPPKFTPMVATAVAELPTTTFTAT